MPSLTKIDVMNDFKYNKTNFITSCAYALLQLKIKRLHPKNNSRYCHLRGDLFHPPDNMIDHVWFMVYRDFQKLKRQVTFKLKIKTSDLDI